MSNFPAGGPQGPPAPKDYPLAQASPVLLQPTIATGGPVTASPYTTANAPFAQPGGAYAQQYPYSSTSQYSSQTQYSHVVPPGMETRLPIEAAMSGRWRDGICDCCSNLWPSCLCAWFCWHGSWIVAQMSNKTSFVSFRSIIIPYFIVAIICFFLSVVTGLGWIMAFPGVIVWIFAILLRIHIARQYNITSGGALLEGCTGFWCCCCSIAQMARHVYGYTKVFDGDSDPDKPDTYYHGPVQIQPGNVSIQSGGGAAPRNEGTYYPNAQSNGPGRV